jgi:sec-independent protein translocase protein TatA
VIGDFLQPTHLIFILLVALVFLGPKRLPEVGKALGKGLRDFRGAMNGIEEQSRDIFDSKSDDAQRQPEPVMATSTSSEEPALSGTATQESPAVAPRVDESSSVV